jgi:hypothetical protein
VTPVGAVAIALAGLLTGCAAVADVEPDPPPDAPSPAFEISATREVVCRDALRDHARCYEVRFQNVGSARGNGYCDLRERGSSDFRVLGSVSRHVRFEDAAPGRLEQTVVVAVWPGRRGKYDIPTSSCYPVPRYSL